MKNESNTDDDPYHDPRGFETVKAELEATLGQEKVVCAMACIRAIFETLDSFLSDDDDECQFKADILSAVVQLIRTMKP